MPTATAIPKKTRKPKAAKIVGRKNDALFIVEKYVKPGKIDFKRDMIFAYKLIEKFSEIGFWRSLECRFQLDSLVILWSPQSREKLKFAYKRYKENLEMQKKIVIPKKVIYHLQDEKCGEDYVAPKRKPRTVLEFLK